MFFLFVFLIYILGAFFAYGKLPFTFFQQDEWLVFGIFNYWIKAGLDWEQRLSSFGATHVVPLNNFLFYFQFKFFGMNFAPYATLNILLHVTNALLVYYLANIFTKKKLISFIAGLLFLVNPITDQTIIWVANTLGTAGSTFFSLLSIIFFTYYLLKGERISNLILSVVFLITSFNFKETSLFLLLFFPILWLLYGKNRNYLKAFKTIAPFLILGFVYFLLRVYLILNGNITSSSDSSLVQPPIIVYFYRLITLPIKFIVESIVPVNAILKAGREVMLLGYPQFVREGVVNPYILESVASDIVITIIFFVSLLCYILGARYFKKTKRIDLTKLVSISLIFISLSSLPLIVVPGRAGYLSLIDGRHLYHAGVFSSLLLSITFNLVYTSLKKYNVLKVFLLIIFSFYIFSNLMKIRSDVNQQVGVAFVRKNILLQVKDRYAKLPDKVVFYMEGDKAYYGLPVEEKIFPFQSGLGQTLLVWYNEYGADFPSCFFENPKFLYALESEGYRECDGRGFGYFRKKESLISAIRKGEFYPKDVVAFRYNSDKQLLTDITKNIKNELQ